MYKTQITPSQKLDNLLSNFFATSKITTLRSTGGTKSNICNSCKRVIVGFDAVEYLHDASRCYECDDAIAEIRDYSAGEESMEEK